MNRDLEETLKELGPEYRMVVARLRGAQETATRETGTTRGTRDWLIAASLLIVVALSVPCFSRLSRPLCPSSRLPPREFRATVDEMIATQNPDGGWKNDFLTRRNAAALKLCGDPAARIAYKKAVRNLRAHGVL